MRRPESLSRRQVQVQRMAGAQDASPAKLNRIREHDDRLGNEVATVRKGPQDRGSEPTEWLIVLACDD